MNTQLLQWLACPACRNDELRISVDREGAVGDVMAGTISCPGCAEEYPVERGVPRLLPRDLRDKLNVRITEAAEDELEAYQSAAIPAVGRLLESLSSEAEVTLDIGSGRGPYLHVLRGDVICVDIVPQFLHDLVDASPSSVRVHPVCASATHLPFRRGVADLVFSSEVIEHLTPQEAGRAVKNWPTFARKWCVIDTVNGDENALITKVRHLAYRTRSLTDVSHPDLPELDHHSTFTSAFFERAGYRCHGCIGWVSRQRFPLGPVWDLYDAVAWRFPAIGGTLVAISPARGGSTHSFGI